MIELKVIRESTEDFDAIERALKELFKREIYVPLMREFTQRSSHSLLNSMDDLLEAIRRGRITFSRGVFSGYFSAAISKELKALGAKWSRSGNAFRLRSSELPQELRHAISVSDSRFQQKLDGIDRKLAQILPEEIAGRVRVSKIFDRALWKADGGFEESIKGITVAPKLTKEARAKIAAEWQNNMELWVKDFTEEEIKKLRGGIKKAAFAGNRYQTAIQAIQESYGVSANKAKFLARQETSLLVAKFKETRYTSAGLNEYKWGCVAGSKNHPVRPWHKMLEQQSDRGKIFSWSDPPITSKPGTPVRRNNPGGDYNCRCFPRVVVRFAPRDDQKR